MAAYTVEIKLPPHTRGDKWEAIESIGPILINGATPSLALSRVRMHFKKGNEVYKLDSDATDRNAPITISNATTWEASIPPVTDGFLPTAGKWNWDMEFYEQGVDAPRTLYKGEIEILQDQTV